MKAGFIAAGLCLAVAGCATITRGTNVQIQIHSSPPGAEARTSMGHTCVTPCTLQFSRKDEFTVTMNMRGYHPETVPVVTRLGGEGAAGFAGNIILGGVVGGVVDVASGATLEHCPNPVSVTLQPIGKPHVTTDYVGRCKPPLVAERNPGVAQ